MKNIQWPVDPQWAEKTDRLFELMAAQHVPFSKDKGTTISQAEEASLQIIWGCAELCAMLLHKNKAYGNSALAPDELFPTGMNPVQLIKTRLNDKFRRLKAAKSFPEVEDLFLDIKGYLILLRIAEHNQSDNSLDPHHYVPVGDGPVGPSSTMHNGGAPIISRQ